VLDELLTVAKQQKWATNYC